MSKLSKLFLALFTLGVAFTGVAQAQETVLKSGQTFALRISGVPLDEVNLVSQPFAISDLGTVKLPYLKTPIKASGMKPSTLARAIESAYKKAEIYTNPTIQISVAAGTAGGAERFVSVIGEVKVPRGVGFTTGMTMLDAIAQCSGFSDFADKKKVKLTRGDKVTYHKLNTGDPTQNVRLQPNDIITVRPGGKIFGR